MPYLRTQDRALEVKISLIGAPPIVAAYFDGLMTDGGRGRTTSLTCTPMEYGTATTLTWFPPTRPGTDDVEVQFVTAPSSDADAIRLAIDDADAVVVVAEASDSAPVAALEAALARKGDEARIVVVRAVEREDLHLAVSRALARVLDRGPADGPVDAPAVDPNPLLGALKQVLRHTVHEVAETLTAKIEARLDAKLEAHTAAILAELRKRDLRGTR